MLIGDWPALQIHEDPAHVKGAAIWRAQPSLRSLRALAIRVEANWLLVGWGVPEASLEDVAPALKRALPSVRHAVLGPEDDPDRCERWLRRGARLYMASDTSLEWMTAAMRQADELRLFCGDERIQQVALARQAELGVDLESARRRLTKREAEIVRLVGQGLSNAQIAHALEISGHTVEAHMSAILPKLEVASRLEALEWARRMGF